MTLLQIGVPSPWEVAPGIGSEAAKKAFGIDDILFYAAIALIFICLAEPLKLIHRKNIGRKALNIYGIMVSSSFYLTWAFFAFYISSLPQDNSYTPWWFQYWVSRYALIPIGLYYVFFSILILLLGMDEHFRAKAEETNNWHILEYRGDSMLISNTIKAKLTKELVWRRAEPRRSFYRGIILAVIHIGLGLPYLLTAASFWLNEWYQVYFKEKRMKESLLDMKIEMQKTSLLYNQVNAAQDTARVSVD